MSNNVIDLSGPIAEAAEIALEAMLDDRVRFREEFVDAAGPNMAHPARIEDREHFARLAVDRLCADRSFRETLTSLVISGLAEYARPI